MKARSNIATHPAYTVKQRSAGKTPAHALDHATHHEMALCTGTGAIEKPKSDQTEEQYTTMTNSSQGVKSRHGALEADPLQQRIWGPHEETHNKLYAPVKIFLPSAPGAARSSLTTVKRFVFDVGRVCAIVTWSPSRRRNAGDAWAGMFR
jgi:hypothetical protein